MPERPTRPFLTCRGGLLGLMVCLVALSACSSGTPPKASPSTTTPLATSPSGVAGGGSSTTVPTIAVPAKYQPLYSHLTANLDAYQAAIDALPDAAPATSAGVPAAELLPANGNRLKDLLLPTTLATVDAWLDRFQALGIGGVTLGIKLPMLLPEFGSDADAYATFYSTVADHARVRRLTVDVELGALFCGTAYAKCTSPFNGSYTGFVAASVAQARVVIDRVRPDYLTLLSEPTTEVALTGVQDFKTPQGAARYVHDVLAGIGLRGSTRIGAGAASWLATSFNEAILKENVDYLALHIYPMNAQIAAAIVEDTALARSVHKPIVADEVGLYKTDSANPAGAATADSVYRLDNFSFFAPLDVRFLSITAEWAKKAGVVYLSPFWAGQLFAYLTWTPQLDAASYPSLTQAADQAVSRAFRSGQLTTLGGIWPAAF